MRRRYVASLLMALLYSGIVLHTNTEFTVHLLKQGENGIRIMNKTDMQKLYLAGYNSKRRINQPFFKWKKLKFF
jgi:hypothetical protein